MGAEPVDVVTGADGIPRCAWSTTTPDYTAYHDEEWGRPIHGERALFERISLEAFQSGLSWLTILRKREGFRAAFAGFDPEVVAGFGAAERARLLTDAGIVRNAAKIDATIANAGCVLRLRDAVDGGLDALIWSFAPSGRSGSAELARPAPSRLADVPSTSPESRALASALKRHGFRFVGPTTAYAAMQACGLVDDHVAGCHRSRG